MKRYDALIFDLDGTLWNAASASAKGWNIALRELGLLYIYLSAEDIERVTGNPFEQCVKMLLPNISFTEFPNLIQSLDTHEKKIIEDEGGKLYSGVAEGIRELVSHYRLYLISNCQTWYLECFWKYSKLQNFFSDWDCHGSSHLPKRDMIKKMVNEYRLKEAIYIGDTLGDKQASEEALVDFGYMAYGFGHVEDSTLAFSSFQNLVTFFLEIA